MSSVYKVALSLVGNSPSQISVGSLGGPHQTTLRTEHCDQPGSGDDANLFGFLCPCNPTERRLDLWRMTPRVTIGRDTQNDLVLSGGSISQTHAEILWDEKCGSSSCVIIKDRDSTNGTFINGVRLRTGESRILRQGNEISFGFSGYSYSLANNDYRYIFHHLAASPPNTDLHAQYDIGPELGRGSFGIAYRAISKATGQWVVVKMINQRRLTSQRDVQVPDDVCLQREIAIMRKLRHPNICELMDVFIFDDEIGSPAPFPFSTLA
ncbi:hypothetical protein PM082_022261 [Marasmius tenuissimus]|nr:hypothetical protein PM082_022261 [Marasmius tenuissimus]